MRKSRFTERQIVVVLKQAEAGVPVENAFIESFNGRFRDECLSQTWFTDIEDARVAIEAWKKDYNESRPHTSLGGLAPKRMWPSCWLERPSRRPYGLKISHSPWPSVGGGLRLSER